MTLVPHYFGYEIIDVSVIFTSEFCTWRMDRAEYSFLFAEGTLWKLIDCLRLILLVAIETYRRREENWWSQINRSVGSCTEVGRALCRQV
jgi:hypothetical protein